MSKSKDLLKGRHKIPGWEVSEIGQDQRCFKTVLPLTGQRYRRRKIFSCFYSGFCIGVANDIYLTRPLDGRK